MSVGKVSSTPQDANVSSAEGSETQSSSSSSTTSGSNACDASVSSFGKDGVDFVDTVRDWFTGDASGREVWSSAKEVGQSAKEVFDTCAPAEKFNQPPEFVLDPMLPPGY
ncbi:MAG TPA: hypothetical protein VGG33_28470 [Polyangia bacterium]